MTHRVIHTNKDQNLDDVFYFQETPYTMAEINSEFENLSEDEYLAALNSQFGVSAIEDASLYEKIELGFSEEMVVKKLTFPNSHSKMYIGGINSEFRAIRAENSGESFTIISENIFEIDDQNKAHPVGDNVNEPDTDFCQREGGESRSDCEDREYEEYTDDWVGFISYYTNPLVPVLIAVMCKCAK